MLVKSLLLSTLAAAASAQSYNATYVAGLSQFLQSIGLTSFATAINSSASSPGTQYLLENVNGTSKTLLAPTNDAFTGLAANATTNTTLLGSRLSYHLLAGTFANSSISLSPNHTVAKTFLNDPSLVQLEGNQTQSLILANLNNTYYVGNQNTNVTIVNTTSYQDLLIHVVDAVIDTPGTISAALDTFHLTLIPPAIEQVGLTQILLNTHGLTIFAPNDAAVSAVQTSIQSSNNSVIENILLNHIINGTTAYSTQLGGGSYTSAGGQQFNIVSNGSGIFVTNGGTTAQVVQSDILTENGVIHIIDHVFLNSNFSGGAAQSAYSAATSSAAQGASHTGAGGNPTPTNTGAVGTTSKSAGYRVDFDYNKIMLHAALLFGGVFAGAVLLI